MQERRVRRHKNSVNSSESREFVSMHVHAGTQGCAPAFLAVVKKEKDPKFGQT